MNNTYTAVGAANQLLRNGTDGRPLSHEIVPGSSLTVTHLNVPTHARAAIVQFEAADLSAWTNDTIIARFWFDTKAVAVTTTTGMAASNMTMIEINNPEALRSFNFILTEAQSAGVNVQYFKY